MWCDERWSVFSTADTRNVLLTSEALTGRLVSTPTWCRRWLVEGVGGSDDANGAIVYVEPGREHVDASTKTLRKSSLRSGKITDADLDTAWTGESSDLGV